MSKSDLDWSGMFPIPFISNGRMVGGGLLVTVCLNSPTVRGLSNVPTLFNFVARWDLPVASRLGGSVATLTLAYQTRPSNHTAVATADYKLVSELLAPAVGDDLGPGQRPGRRAVPLPRARPVVPPSHHEPELRDPRLLLPFLNIRPPDLNPRC